MQGNIDLVGRGPVEFCQRLNVLEYFYMPKVQTQMSNAEIKNARKRILSAEKECSLTNAIGDFLENRGKEEIDICQKKK